MAVMAEWQTFSHCRWRDGKYEIGIDMHAARLKSGNQWMARTKEAWLP